MGASYAIGLDYGTNSVRAVVVDCDDGRSVGTHVFDYPSGEQGVLLDAEGSAPRPPESLPTTWTACGRR